MSKEGDDPWLIVVVQKSYQQSKIFKYQLAEKLRSDVQAQYRPRICSVKVNEGQNEEQWIELMNRIKVKKNSITIHPVTLSTLLRKHLLRRST